MVRMARGLFAAALLLCLALPARAQTLELSNLVLDNQAGSLMVRFSLDLTDESELEEILKDGARLKLLCEARLSRERSFYLDATVSDSRLESLLYYDSLTQEFIVSIPGREQPFRGRRLWELLTETWGKLSMDLGPFEAVERRANHRLNIKVSLKYDDVPAWLRGALFFWSWEAAPTVSYRMDFQF